MKMRPFTVNFHKRASSILLLALFLSSLIAQTANGQATLNPKEPADYPFYANNDIIWYDPNATCGVSTNAVGEVKLVGNTTEEKIWNFLRAKGLTPEQTAGVMGNIQAESGFKTEALEDNGVGYGIVQWSFKRRTDLEAAAKLKSIPVSDLGFQLEYLYQELNARPADRPEYKQYGNEWKAINAQPTVEDALVAFHHEFEISHLMDEPDPRKAVITARAGFAYTWFNKFSKNAATEGAGKDAGSCNKEVTALGKFPDTLLSYAWPTYRGDLLLRERTLPTKGWEQVIATYPGKGRYIGGTLFPGIDCGGFVTNLVIDSGFDTNYNFQGLQSKGAGNTIEQKKWLDINWENITVSKFKNGSADPAQLKTGDVAINSTHTFIYTGNPQVPGFGAKVASASWDDRAPMADTAQNAADPAFIWYRKR